MELIHFNFEIEFPESGQLYTPAYRVYKALGGKAKDRRSDELGARIRNKELRTIIYWHYDSCDITIEHIINSNRCIESVMQYLEIINSVAPITKIENRKLVTHWMLPAPNHTFTSLERLYREKSVTQYNYMNGVYDSSVLFDSKINNYIFHHQSGPMEPNQVNIDFLEFERNDLPKTFIFLYTSIEDRDGLKYKEEEMKRFIEKAFEYCLTHSKQFGEVWEGNL